MDLVGRFLVVAIVFAGIVSLGTLITKRGAEVRARVSAQVDSLTTPIDSATGSALYGRYRAQRDAAAAMRTYLESLVALDSTLARDTAYPGSFLRGVQLLSPFAGSMGPEIHVTRSGWWAKIQSFYSTITCAVAVGPDTVIRDTPSGSPVCYGQDWN